MSGLGARFFDMTQRDKKAYLLGPRQVRSIAVRAALCTLLLVICAVWATWRISGGGDGHGSVAWLDVVLGGLLGLSATRAALTTVKVAQAYRDGWLDGRLAFIEALAEAGQRGMPIEDALRAQYEIDLRLFGGL